MKKSVIEEHVINAIYGLQDVYRMLEDDISKDIFLKRLAYTVSGDSAYIADIVRKYRPEFTFLRSWGGTETLYALIPDEQSYVIWGAGFYGAKCLDHISDDKRFIAFCDRDVMKQKNGFYGYDVISPDEIFSPEYAKVAVIVASANYEKEILQQLLERGKSEKDIYLMGSVIGRASDKQYFDEEFIRFGEKEIFVDAGCYDLETTKKFYRLCPQLKKVYAFEPDPDNYEVCQRIKKENKMDMVKLFPYGTWDRKTALSFSPEGDSSRIKEGGEQVVDVISIDEILEEEDVTYIKMDVEGAEYHSLIGARKTIQRCRPKLAISIYHKPEDIVVLLMYVKSLVSDYRFYLRHYSNADNETVLYAIP